MKKMFIPHWVQYTAVGPLCRDDLKIISANPNPMVTDPSTLPFQAEMGKGLRSKLELKRCMM